MALNRASAHAVVSPTSLPPFIFTVNSSVLPKVLANINSPLACLLHVDEPRLDAQHQLRCEEVLAHQ